MAKRPMKYYKGVFEVKTSGSSERTAGSAYGVETRKEVFLADPSDIEGYAEGYALKQSSFPGQYKYMGKANLADDFNEVTKGLRGEESRRGLISRLFRRKAISILTIVGLAGGIFFLSNNLTGNVIGSSKTSNLIGVILLFIGLVAGFFLIRGKNISTK